MCQNGLQQTATVFALACALQLPVLDDVDAACYVQTRDEQYPEAGREPEARAYQDSRSFGCTGAPDGAGAPLLQHLVAMEAQ